MSLTLTKAQHVLTRALEAARAQGVEVAVVVVDRAGRPVVSARTDGTGFMSMAAAERKAATAANFGQPTQVMADFASKDALIAGALHNAPDVLILPGGMPIPGDDTHVGAVGIAGGHYSQDHALAAYAVG